MDRLRLGLITAGFLGCAPVAPGTFGTLAGVLIAWALRSTQPFLAVLLGICVVLYLVGRALAPWAEKEHGKDPGCFVLDEVIGYLICVAWVAPPSWFAMGVAFVLFRFFDILKPWPVRWFEQLGGGDGILLDDVAAGLYGLGVMALLRYLLPGMDLWVHNGVL
ncbi:MAG: phosphatidylglycerophosphatase A [Planctomycetota bacterium]|jgi:phosphatidylglycerophosphatase A|nr:phosphatidylglycerophosphatase A [Planctomycetota bacterium]